MSGVNRQEESLMKIVKASSTLRICMLFADDHLVNADVGLQYIA